MALLTAQLDKGIKQIGRRAMRDALRDALRVVGRYWQRYYLPIHFTKAAMRRYHYAPRKGDPGSGRAFRGSYQWKKLRKYNTTAPLVYTGESRQRARTGSVSPKAQSAERGYVDVVIPAQALNFQPPKFKGNMRREVTAVTMEEATKLEAIMYRDIEKRITRTLARA